MVSHRQCTKHCRGLELFHLVNNENHSIFHHNYRDTDIFPFAKSEEEKNILNFIGKIMVMNVFKPLVRYEPVRSHYNYQFFDVDQLIPHLPD